MKPHKDLPSGSQPWANEVDQLLSEVKELREVVRRLTENAGIDFANPKRGVNAGAMPSAKNPVGQKLSSLSDVQTYNVLDKQVLAWSQQGQKWLPVTTSAAFPVPEPIAGFPDATGYGYLPAVTDGPYSVLAQNGAFDGDGVFNLVTRDSAGRINSVRSGYYYGLELESTDAVAVRAGERTGLHSRADYSQYQIALKAFEDGAEETYGSVEVGKNNVEMTAFSPDYQVVIGVNGVCAYVRAPYLILPSCTSATRPTNLDVAATVYDDTLKKIICYDYAASVWRDALGTAV